MITIYNYIDKVNYKDVISKMTKKGYPLYLEPEESEMTFPEIVESVFTIRALEEVLGITLPSGDKKFEQFLVDKEPITRLYGSDFASSKKGLWAVEKEVIPNNDEDTDFSPQHYGEELLANSKGITAFEALKEGLSYVLGDFSQEQLDDLPFLANELDLNFEVKHVFAQDWGTTITTIRKTNKFRLRNKYHDWFIPFVVGYKGDERKEVFFDFSYSYAETVEELSELLSASTKEIEETKIYLPFCKADGTKTGEMLSTYLNLKKAHNHALYLEEVLAESEA